MQDWFSIRNCRENPLLPCESHFPSYNLWKKKWLPPSSVLILQLLIRQTQTDFGGDPPDYGEGLEVRIVSRPTSLPFPSFAQSGWKIQREMLVWCDTSKEENRMKNTSAPCATHAQFISWTVWWQSNSEMEQPTTAIKYQFAPTPLTCFLSAACTLLLRGLLRVSDIRIRYILWGRLCKPYTYINCVNKNTHTHTQTKEWPWPFWRSWTLESPMCTLFLL